MTITSNKFDKNNTIEKEKLGILLKNTTIGSTNNLDYLDLEIFSEKKYRRLKNGSVIKCKFTEGDHILHSDNHHLNAITDLTINLAEHTQLKDNRNFRKTTKPT